MEALQLMADKNPHEFTRGERASLLVHCARCVPCGRLVDYLAFRIQEELRLKGGPELVNQYMRGVNEKLKDDLQDKEFREIVKKL
jgi:hypothetical protein